MQGPRAAAHQVRNGMLRSLYLAAVFALPPHAQLQARLAQIVQMPAFAHASFGLAIYDLDRRRTLYVRNADKYFLAASTTKLLTEGASLAILGPRHRFVTNVYRTGAIDPDGVLHGDVVLRASGDPNLSARPRPDDTLAFENEDHSYDGGPQTKAVNGDPLKVLESFASQIAARGVKRITGRVIVDDSLYAGNFPEAGTGAVVSPVMINDNIVDVTVAPGSAPGEPVRFNVSPQTAYARFVNRAVTCARRVRPRIVIQDGDGDAAGSETVTIKGCVPQGAKPVLYAYDVPSPRRFAEMALTGVLQRDGIDVAQTTADRAPVPAQLAPFYGETNVIATHRSAPLSQDVKVTLKVSDNLHADTMPYLWANGDLGAAFALERRWLSRGGLSALDVVQNDGLGADAYIQPAMMVKYLAFLRKQPFFGDILHALPVLGKDGTLFDIQTRSPAAGKVFAKTGTWSVGDGLNGRSMVNAKGLAGYMTTRSGRHVAFCFYVNNFAGAPGSDAAHQAGEELGALATATYLYAR